MLRWEAVAVFALEPGGREGGACSSAWTAFDSSIAVPSSSVCGGSVRLPLLGFAALGIATLISNMMYFTKSSCIRGFKLEFQLSVALCYHSTSW